MKFVNYIYISILITIISLTTFSNTHTASKNTKSFSELKANSKAKLDKRDLQAYRLSTKLKDSKGGSILSLEDHEVECSNNNVLTGFHLWGKKGIFSNDVSFEYNCTPNKAIQKIESKQKSKKVTYGNAKNALEKLADIEVKCQDGFLLKEFELEESHKKIYWKYKCIQTYSENCEEKFTNYKNARFGGFLYKSVSELSAHKVQATKGYGLQGFKGENSSSEFRLAYTQCKFTVEAAKTTEEKNTFANKVIKKTKDVKNAIKSYFKKSNYF